VLLDRGWPATEISLSDARAMFETNFFGIIGINQTFLPLLRKAQGTILYVGTAGAISPVPWLSVYTASKVALYA
jgi:1-acylglycerone phosphate reductase